MDFQLALLRSGKVSDYTDKELTEAFDTLVHWRDEAQDGLSRIQRERMRRTEEEVKRLRAEIAAKA